jgi:hypothetical protein
MTQNDNSNPFDNNCDDNIKCEFLQFVTNPTNLIMVVFVVGLIFMYATK